MTDHILTEIRDHILLIRINRPEARNAFNRAMADRMEEIIDSYDANKALRAAVIVAEGPTFSAGQDLIEAAAGGMARTPRRGGFGLFAQPPEKPLIAAIEGQALAGGMELALCCDIIVASEQAVFGLAEVKRGLVAIGGGCFRLPRRIPYNVAMEMIITAQTRSARDMERFGFVNRVVTPGQTEAAALEIAATIAANSPLAVRASKQIAAQSAAQGWPDAEAWQTQLKLIEPATNSRDLKEGLKAFAEKRAPQWSGE